ncbi:hypothetical protein WR25_09799 [Diploscapter pachys]|uniref:Uncharacterized protein n=1 Tax=Diploscapter pachys TaxID=2018661 RepID=A0A2A2KG25_9BILA|nr:hypothetical protein WR25_09799 [Diploscapter pachys]
MIPSTFLPLPRSLSQPLPLSLLIAISLQWIIQLVAELDGIKRIHRLSVSGHIAAYVVESALTDGQYELLNQHNGNPLVGF